MDASGHRSVWGLSDSRTIWRNRIDVPGFPVRVHYSINLHADPETYVQRLVFGFGHYAPALLRYPDRQACDPDGLVSVARDRRIELVAHPAFDFAYQLQQGYHLTGSVCEPVAGAVSGPRHAIRVPFDFAELINGGRGELRLNLLVRDGLELLVRDGLELRIRAVAGTDYSGAAS